MQLRPRSVTVLSIIGIVLASLATLGIVMRIYALSSGVKDEENPIVTALMQDKACRIFSNVSSFIGYVTLPVLWIGAIGSLRLKKIGRSMMLIYACISLPANVVDSVFQFVYAMPKIYIPAATAEAAREGLNPRSLPAITYTAVSVILALTMYYLISILVYFNKPKTKNAFDGIFEATGKGYAVEFSPQVPEEEPPELEPK